MYKNIRFFLASFLVLVVIVLAVLINPSFSNAKSQSEVMWGCATQEPVTSLNFGCSSNVDIVTGPWVLNDFNGNHINWLNNFLDQSNETKTPYMYTYVIAGMARQEWGLQDCNIDPVNNLCIKGSTYLQLYEDEIITKYTTIANSIRDNLTTSNLYIHIEPDYFQYNSNTQEWPLAKNDAWRIMNRISSVFESIVPQAQLVLDISPWNYGLADWCSGFNGFDYGGLVGKWFDANQNPDGQSYENLKNDCGYELVINTAHGPGGQFNAYNQSWEGKNHNAHAIIQSPLESDRYGNYIASIRPGGSNIVVNNDVNPQPAALFQNQNTSAGIGGQEPSTEANPETSAANNAEPKTENTEPNKEERKIEFSYPSSGIVNINGKEYYSTEQLDAAIEKLKPVE